MQVAHVAYSLKRIFCSAVLRRGLTTEHIVRKHIDLTVCSLFRSLYTTSGEFWNRWHPAVSGTVLCDRWKCVFLLHVCTYWHYYTICNIGKSSGHMQHYTVERFHIAFIALFECRSNFSQMSLYSMISLTYSFIVNRKANCWFLCKSENIVKATFFHEHSRQVSLNRSNKAKST